MSLNLKGNWLASINSPVLSNGTGVIGDLWYIAASGLQDLGTGTRQYNKGMSLLYTADGTWNAFAVSYKVPLNEVYGSGGPGTLPPYTGELLPSILSYTVDTVSAFTSGSTNISTLEQVLLSGNIADHPIILVDNLTLPVLKNVIDNTGVRVTYNGTQVAALNGSSTNGALVLGQGNFNAAIFPTTLSGDWLQQLPDKSGTFAMLSDIINTSGTVTSFSTSGISTLFTTSVATPTTTPNLTFSPIEQTANKFYASPNGTSGIPLWRSLVIQDFNNGTNASATSFWRGDGLWAQTSGNIGTVTSIFATSGLTANPNPIISSGNIGLPSIGIPGTYGSSSQIPVITTDAFGRVSNITLIGTEGTSGITSLTSPDNSIFTSGVTTSGGTSVVVELNTANANTWTALQTYQFNNIKTTVTDAIIISNATPATSAIPVQQSGTLRLTASGWNSVAGLSYGQDVRIYNVPQASGSPSPIIHIDGVNNNITNTFTNMCTIGAGGITAPAFISAGLTFGPSGITGASGNTITLKCPGGALANNLIISTTNNVTLTSGSYVNTGITTIYNQASATTANTDLLINRIETAIGSGVQRLISGQVSGVEKFGVDNTGGIFVSGVSSFASSVTFNNGLSVALAKKITIATGTNAITGTATLSSGTVTISTTAVTASSIIWVQYQSGTAFSIGVGSVSTAIKVSSQTAGTGFVITAYTVAGVTNTTDNSPVQWLIFN